VAEKIKAYAETIVQHLSKAGMATRCDFSSSVLKWSPPPAGLALINVGAALFSSSSSMGMGVVIRDSDARCLVACNERLEHVTDPELAEALACRRGLNLDRDEGFSKVMVASDCLSLVLRLQSAAKDRSGVGTVVADIKNLAASFFSLFFCSC
jgi:hypothetical protein